jgi:hypothetical protein
LRTKLVFLFLVISLIKTLENDIGIKARHVILVNIFHERARLRLYDTDVVDPTRADLDHFAVHQGLN